MYVLGSWESLEGHGKGRGVYSRLLMQKGYVACWRGEEGKRKRTMQSVYQNREKRGCVSNRSESPSAICWFFICCRWMLWGPEWDYQMYRWLYWWKRLAKGFPRNYSKLNQKRNKVGWTDGLHLFLLWYLMGKMQRRMKMAGIKSSANFHNQHD